LPLRLIDSTANYYVSQVITLPIQLPCSLLCEIECYVMPLNNSCELVLGYNWLKNHNPSINWRRGTMNLPKPKCEELPTSNKPKQPYPTESHYPTPRKPDISLINTVAYHKACKVEGAIVFQLQPSRELTLSSQASQITESTPKLNEIPEEYHEYLEVFSKTKAKTLPIH